MIKPGTKEAIKEMRSRNMAIKSIADLLEISRNSVKSVLSGKHDELKSKNSKHHKHLPIIRELYPRCSGNAVRIGDLLKEEYAIDIPYSTLRWLINKDGLGKAEKRPAGSYCFAPGEEMQHDTSPYRIKLGNRMQTAQCASLALAYCRKIYIRFYPCFTRFEARCFLIDAFKHMDGSCARCTIDNTSVLVAQGAGANAVIAPEMRQIGRLFGTVFIPHSVGHSDRKARVERPFYYVERNFLVGRTFRDWKDLNQQGVEWCIHVSDKKEKRSLKMSPAQAYIMEKPFLKPLPPYIPPVYSTSYRIVDVQGYVHLDTNRYSVPYQLIGKQVEVQKHQENVVIYHGREKIAQHQRVLEKRDKRICDDSHKISRVYPARGESSSQERALKGTDPVLDTYLVQLKKRSHGRGVAKFSKLLELKRTYPEEAFMMAIRKAQTYGLYDLARLEKLILSFIAGDYFNL
ncbi:MAG: IS21 family transposase [Methanococcoides sp.]|nr:IS21 family transposase [Methanococcoides sp.]